jgi:thiamine-phosphate pyrophosphorylase
MFFDGTNRKDLVRSSLFLCAVTDRHWIQNGKHSLEDQVESAIAGGATMIQLREKNMSLADFIDLAIRIGQITRAHGIPLVINDSLEAALASDADGLHIGQDDGDPEIIRKSLKSGQILGISAHTPREAKAAELAGADYIGIGAAFPTGSKNDVNVLTPVAIRAIAAAAKIPSVAIGGITARNVQGLRGLGLSGIAAISAIFAEPDKVRGATENLAVAAHAIFEKGNAQ